MTRRPTLALLATAALLAGGSLAAPLPTTPDPAAYQAGPAPAVVPAPREASFPAGTLGLEGLALAVAGAAPELQWAARDLNAETRARLGRTLEAGQERAVRIGTFADAGLAAQARARGLEPPPAPEGYVLWVDALGAAVVGVEPIGAYRGVQTLRQLLGPQGFRFASLRDWPQFPVRMAMIYLDRFSQPTNDILVPMLARLKYNQVLVMSNYVQWDSTRNLWNPAGATKAEARRVADLVRSYGMEPVPLIETLGHAGWMFANGQNRDLAQDPESPSPFAYDTLNPRTYTDVVLPVLREAVEVFRPKLVHVGHDEVRNVDRFPARPNGIAAGFAKLFVDDTVKLHDFLASLGVGTVIWHDTALADSGGDEILPQLPKDIVIANWQYSAGNDFPTLSRIRDAGFRALGASWYREDNPESLAAAAAREDALGMIQTRWTGYFGNPSVFDGQAEQGVAYVRAAAAFWNPAQPGVPDAGARYRDGYRAASYRPIGGRLVDLSALVNRKLADPDETQWVQKGPDVDLSAVPTGTARLGAYRFNLSGAVMTRGSRAAASDLPASVTLELGGKAAALALLHTTGWNLQGDTLGQAPQPRRTVGAYTLTYEDGTTARLPVEYGRHISWWLAPTPRSVLYDPVWRGKTRDGLDAGLNVLVWPNPNPDKSIRSLTLDSEGLEANPTLVGLTLLDSVPQEAQAR